MYFSVNQNQPEQYLFTAPAVRISGKKGNSYEQ